MLVGVGSGSLVPLDPEPSVRTTHDNGSDPALRRTGIRSTRGTQGHGITGMRDRMGAIGGELAIASVPGQGATVTGHVPLNGA
jgi:glucose-6-phosphate-specific signal transduction histidine kinase